MTHSISLATWFWLIFPFVTLVALSILHYIQEGRNG